MTDVDEHLLAAAKLQEQKRGDMDTRAKVHAHAGEVVDDRHATSLSFVESTLAELEGDGTRFEHTRLGRQVTRKFRTDRADRAVAEGEGTALAHLNGITEDRMKADSLTLHARLDAQLANNDAPAFVTAAGNPNTGKTNTMLLLAELRRASHEARGDDYLVVSNMRDSLTDVRVTSAHELAVALFENRDVPKFVVIDEGSTHFDSRTNRREVATQYTPLAKRFAKVDVFGVIGHTGKDIHPEQKRLTTLAVWKLEKTVAEFFSRWSADADRPSEPVFPDPIEGIQPTSARYDPDDSAPWSWNLRAGCSSAT